MSRGPALPRPLGGDRVRLVSDELYTIRPTVHRWRNNLRHDQEECPAQEHGEVGAGLRRLSARTRRKRHWEDSSRSHAPRRAESSWRGWQPRCSRSRQSPLSASAGQSAAAPAADLADTDQRRHEFVAGNAKLDELPNPWIVSEKELPDTFGEQRAADEQPNQDRGARGVAGEEFAGDAHRLPPRQPASVGSLIRLLLLWRRGQDGTCTHVRWGQFEPGGTRKLGPPYMAYSQSKSSRPASRPGCLRPAISRDRHLQRRVGIMNGCARLDRPKSRPAVHPTACACQTVSAIQSQRVKGGLKDDRSKHRPAGCRLPAGDGLRRQPGRRAPGSPAQCRPRPDPQRHGQRRRHDHDDRGVQGTGRQGTEGRLCQGRQLRRSPGAGRELEAVRQPPVQRLQSRAAESALDPHGQAQAHDELPDPRRFPLHAEPRQERGQDRHRRIGERERHGAGPLGRGQVVLCLRGRGDAHAVLRRHLAGGR